MATAEQCEQALRTLADRVASSGGSAASRAGEQRLACNLTDLDTAFFVALRDGGLHDIAPFAAGTPLPSRGADDGHGGRLSATLTMTSDDLIGMVDGTLGLVGAWTSGRVRIDASVLDLMRIRGFF